MATQTTFGSFLQALRVSRSLSMNALSKQAAISQSTLSRWESGKTLPRLFELESALKALNATPAQRQQAIDLINAPRAVKAVRKANVEAASWQATPSVHAPRGGDLLKAMRLRKRLRLEQLARAMNVTHATISRWERSEMWPSEQNLHRLCFLLDASEDELLRLTLGPIFLAPGEQAITQESARQVLLHINANLYEGGVSWDLLFLDLKSKLFTLAGKHAWAQELLHETYAFHAHALSTMGRLSEAYEMSHHAFDLRPKRLPAKREDWLAVFALARSSVHRGKSARPKLGVEVVKRWLADIDEKPYLAWAHSYLAEYESLQGHTDSALELAQKARDTARAFEDNTIELRRRAVDLGLLLLKHGRPHHALETLAAEAPITFRDHRQHDPHEMLAFARIYAALNRFYEAQDWLNLYDTFVQFKPAASIKALQPQADALRQELALKG